MECKEESCLGMTTQGMFNETGLTRWFRCMIQLSSLEIINYNGKLPMVLVLKLIRRNIHSLRKLNLQGGINFDEETCSTLEKLKIEELTLGGYIKHDKGFSQLIKSQSNLRYLKFVAMEFAIQEFQNIPESIRVLKFVDCWAVPSSLAGFARLNSLRELEVIQKYNHQPSSIWRALFHRSLFIKTLTKLRMKMLTGPVIFDERNRPPRVGEELYVSLSYKDITNRIIV